ncbi:MAG: LPD38 domain-containing protein [Rikenellaceae bacterium]
MKYVKSQLQEYENMSGKEKKENSHIPLTMYGIAKAAAVDARLVQSDAEDAEQSKTNEAVRQTLRALKDSAKYKGTVAIFADNYRNRHSGFNLYEDVRSKLIAEGIPADQIVVMKSGMSIKKKLDIFAKVNSGDVRVVLGSTFTLGTGVNIQERLHTLIHLDAPNRPMDYTQRNGRILRQGNLHKDMGIPVRVLRFGVEDSLDVTAYQRLKTKGAIADSIMNGKQMLVNSMTNRVLEEEEDAFGDTIAQLSGSEYAMLKNNAEKNVRKYESRKKQWEADQTYIHNAKPRLKGLINATEMRIAQNSKYLQSVQQAFADGKYENIVVGKNKFSSIDEMTDFFKQYNKSVAEESKRMKEGGDADEQTRELVVNIGDFTFSIKTILSKETTYLGNRSLFSEVHRKMTYSCPELGIEDAPVHQMLLRNAIVDITENVITGNDFAEIIDAAERSIQHNRSELEQLLSREGKPFEHTEELNQAYAQYKEYSELMKVEMEAKEAKYTEMDQSVEAIDDLAELEDEDDVIFRSVYHGSPYSFDKFDHSFMGTGEGAQAFGWGTYVTEVEGVGRHYAEMKNSEGERNLYNVEIPDDNGSNYLMWDDVVDEDVVSKVSDVAMSMDYDTDYMLDSYDSMMDQNNLTGDVFYPMMVSTITDLDGNSITPMVASEILHKAGFIGVSYPAEATSGGRKDNARNYVIFDEADLEITDHTMFRKSINTTKPTNQELANHAQSIVDKLNLNNVEILDNTKGLKGKKRKAKGFYSKSTGKITIVVPNNSSVEDIEQTILHEAVAHYGLRKLFGDHFEEFLDKIFANADEAIRKNIVDLSAKNDWDFRKATEEYLATLAEDTNFENAESEGWWQKIKLFFAEMLRKLDFSGNISDNELRYILWKSYENLKGGQTNDVFSQAADIAMQDRLRVGEYAEDVLDNDVLFRDSTPTEREKDYATAIYEQRVASGWYQTKEAYQDSMLALKEGLLAILKEVGKILHIEEIAGYMNPYLGENRLSGTNMEEANEYRRKFIKPMLAIVAKLAPNDKEYERTVNCLMAKHGLERNEVLAKRDAQKALDKYKVQHPNTKKTIDDFIGNFRKRDYAGLTALTGFDDVEIAEAEAKAMVEDYESSHDSDDIIALWENINKANTEILRKSYMNGMIDKQTFAKIDDMFKFYIPLRGFDEKTSKDVYSYMSEGKGDFKAAIQGAYGRRSKANDPIANMQLMADSSLMQGNRNKLVKLPLLHFARSNKNNLVSISDYWVEYDEVNEDWVVKLPDTIKESDSSEVIKTKTEEFEQRMIELSNEHPEKYKRQKDAINIPYRIDKKNLREHQVVVYQYGKPIILTINGSPRLAQAVNGLTNPDRGAGVVDWALDLMQHGIRWISLACTSLSIDFLGGNLSRDQTWANTSVWAKESPSYAIRFNKNAARVNPVRMKLLFAKHRNGELDMNDPIDFMFNQFVINGGETGYMNLWDLKKTKRETKREIKRAQRGKKGKIDNSITWLGQLGELSRAIENSPRFAAFVTSKEMGRSLERSIWDAKEITVNFNKKGAGATFFGKTGQTTVGNVAAVAAGLGGVLYMFQNAAVQSTTLAGRLFKRNPAKASALFSAWFALGITNVLLSYNGGDDDDEHSYFEQSPYVRRSNMLIRIGDGKWLASPLPHEFRVPYGLGELIATRIIGKDDMTEAELALAIVEQFSQILPIDMVGGGGLRSFIPDLASPLVEAETNRSWTGYPIYYETDYNENDPNWTKAYSNTNQYLVSVAKWLNDVSGGSDYKSGSIDINPAKVEHLLNGYLGGIYGFADKLVKTVETIAGEREPDARNYPIVNRFYKTGNDTTKDRAVKNAYSKAKAEYEETSRLASKYRKNPPKDIFEEAERSVFFESSEYERYDIFRDYKSAIDKLVSYLKGEIPDDDREIYEDRLNELKKEMIGEMNKTRK